MRRRTETRPTRSPLLVVLRRALCGALLLVSVLAREFTTSAASDNSADSPSVAVGPLWQLRISGATTAAARFLQADSASDLKLTSQTQLAAISRMDQAARTQELRPWLPVSLIRLRNDDRLLLSILRLTATELHAIDGQLRTQTIPRAAIAAIDSPAGVVTTLCSAASPANLWTLDAGKAETIEVAHGSVRRLSHDAALTLPLAQPLSVGQFVLWIKLAESQSSALDVRFEFADGSSIAPQTLELRGGAQPTATARTTDKSSIHSQIVRINSDWVCVRALLDEEQFTIAVDAGVIASGKRFGRRLTAVRVVSTGRAAAVADSNVLLGPVFVQEFVTAKHLPPPLASRGQDAIQLQTGDALFGAITSCDQQRVVIKVRSDEITLPSRDVISMRLGRQPLEARSISGWIARIKLQGQSGNASGSIEDVLRGAIVAADVEGLEFDHALVGRRRIEWVRVRQIEPLFVGTSRLWETGPRHLGSRPRDDFQHAAPEGIRLTISATIDAVPRGNCFLSLWASDLEPAGLQTLRASPTLRDLREGFFATSVFVNGTLIGRLNDFSSQWGSRASPIRIRLPLASPLLRVGANEIEFRQAASRTDATSFDDCELRDIALECE